MKYLLLLITLLTLSLGFSQTETEIQNEIDSLNIEAEILDKKAQYNNEKNKILQLKIEKLKDGNFPETYIDRQEEMEKNNPKFDIHDEFMETKKLLSEDVFEGKNKELADLAIDRIYETQTYKASQEDITYVSDKIFTILTDGMKSFEKDYVSLRDMNDAIHSDNPKNVVSNYKSLNLQLWGRVTDIQSERSATIKFRLIMLSILFVTIGIITFMWIKKKRENEKERLEKESNYETKTKWGTTTKLRDKGQKELNDYMNRYKK